MQTREQIFFLPVADAAFRGNKRKTHFYARARVSSTLRRLPTVAAAAHAFRRENARVGVFCGAAGAACVSLRVAVGGGGDVRSLIIARARGKKTQGAATRRVESVGGRSSKLRMLVQSGVARLLPTAAVWSATGRITSRARRLPLVACRSSLVARRYETERREERLTRFAATKRDARRSQARIKPSHSSSASAAAAVSTERRR